MIQDAAAFQEKRAFQRMPVRVPVKYSVRDDAECRCASSIDISPSGLGIFTDNAVHPDEQLKISIKFLDGDDPLNITGTVVWSAKKMPRLWRAGIRFSQPNFDYLKRLSF